MKWKKKMRSSKNEQAATSITKSVCGNIAFSHPTDERVKVFFGRGEGGGNLVYPCQKVHRRTHGCWKIELFSHATAKTLMTLAVMTLLDRHRGLLRQILYDD